MGEYGSRSVLPTVDTVWNTNTVIRIAGQNEPWYLVGHHLKVRHPLHVPKMVLWHGVRMATDTEVDWCAGDTDEVAEILEYGMLHSVVAQIIGGLLQGSSHKGA
jgi:hypothetical protein